MKVGYDHKYSTYRLKLIPGISDGLKKIVSERRYTPVREITGNGGSFQLIGMLLPFFFSALGMVISSTPLLKLAWDLLSSTGVGSRMAR
ncbi:MAG: hypothetical protein A4E28_00935 [Methanocella sp. PtaU1.Bin125]|nr:MAG: hypothetical protein A4E28_00935 [Methanocella sp. PtaU1.Bin125]